MQTLTLTDTSRVHVRRFRERVLALRQRHVDTLARTQFPPWYACPEHHVWYTAEGIMAVSALMLAVIVECLPNGPWVTWLALAAAGLFVLFIAALFLSLVCTRLWSWWHPGHPYASWEARDHARWRSKNLHPFEKAVLAEDAGLLGPVASAELDGLLPGWRNLAPYPYWYVASDWDVRHDRFEQRYGELMARATVP